MNFCSECGSRLSSRERLGDRAPRRVCPACGKVFYLDPRLVVACLAFHGDRVLLCRRGVEPAYGRWTLPSGFVDAGESTSAAASREALEEARATVTLGRPYALFHIPHANQMQVVYLATLAEAACEAGSETLEARVFAEAEIPWADLAFVTTQVALRRYFEDRRDGLLGFHFSDVVEVSARRSVPATLRP